MGRARKLADDILEHYNETFALPQVSEGAKAGVIGKVRTDGQYVVNYHGKELVNAKAHDVTKGIVYNRPYVSKHDAGTEQGDEILRCAQDDKSQGGSCDIQNGNRILLELLAHENIASRAPIFETYDKQVQGRTVIEAGWADAGVMQPFNEDKYPEEIRQTGIALSLDHNPRYNKIDAYWGAVNAVVESVRNVVAVGATPIALYRLFVFRQSRKTRANG